MTDIEHCGDHEHTGPGDVIAFAAPVTDAANRAREALGEFEEARRDPARPPGYGYWAGRFEALLSHLLDAVEDGRS